VPLWRQDFWRGIFFRAAIDIWKRRALDRICDCFMRAQCGYSALARPCMVNCRAMGILLGKSSSTVLGFAHPCSWLSRECSCRREAKHGQDVGRELSDKYSYIHRQANRLADVVANNYMVMLRSRRLAGILACRLSERA
jgi:hypothetical protein